MELIERLVDIPGPAGWEDAVALAIRDEIDGLGTVEVDGIGNLVLRLPAPAGAPSLMLAAHMDQVGLLVKYVDPSGYLYCEANGLIDERSLLATPVDVWTDAGPRSGVVGIQSRHLQREGASPSIEINDLWVDVGASSADEVAALGIEIGQPVTTQPTTHRLSEHLLATQCADNRAGCAALVEVARHAAATERDYELIVLWAAQEEIGSRGARVAAQWLLPTVAVVLDTLPAWDPSTPARYATSHVGRGPVIRIQDSRAGKGTIYSAAVRRRLREVADAASIPYQLDVFPTWTDACEVHLAGRGVPTGGVFMPRRCSHSPTEVIDVRDVERTIDLLQRFVAELDASALEELAVRPAFPLVRRVTAGTG